MNNDEQKLDVLTDQPVTINLAGREYKAKRATLYDVGVMNRKRKELENAGDTANMDMDLALFMVAELIKPYDSEVSGEWLAKQIPFSAFKDVLIALEVVGFKVPQSTVTEEKKETGA